MVVFMRLLKKPEKNFHDANQKMLTEVLDLGLIKKPEQTGLTLTVIPKRGIPMRN